MTTIGSLFSGIGGLELGLEWAGLGPVVWQVEKDPFCRQVLAKYWPDVERFEDVREFEGRPADIICGGPPCQPFSSASRGRRVAEDLFPEWIRIVLGCRPRFAVAENVKAAPVVSAAEELASAGYACHVVELPAAMVGATHERRRWFLVADANSQSQPHSSFDVEMARIPDLPDHDRWDYARALGMDDGLPNVMDRNRSLGNAVVPQCAEVIGHIIQQLRIGP